MHAGEFDNQESTLAMLSRWYDYPVFLALQVVELIVEGLRFGGQSEDHMGVE